MPDLTHLSIAKPCPANWSEMAGDDRVRHCELCKLNVYNIAALTTSEALALVEKSEGRLCVRLYKRADGTVLTADCPIGVRAAWRRVAWMSASALGAVLTATTTLTAKLSTENGDSVTVFDSASHAAKDFLVKHLPEWMIPEGWKPEEEFVSVGVLMDPSLLRAFTPMSPSARASGGLEPEAEPAPSKEASHEAR